MSSRRPPAKRDDLVEQLVLEATAKIEESFSTTHRDPGTIVDLLLLMQPHLRALVNKVLDREIDYVEVQRIPEEEETPTDQVHMERSCEAALCMRPQQDRRVFEDPIHRI